LNIRWLFATIGSSGADLFCPSLQIFPGKLFSCGFCNLLFRIHTIAPVPSRQPPSLREFPSQYVDVITSITLSDDPAPGRPPPPPPIPTSLSVFCFFFPVGTLSRTCTSRSQYRKYAFSVRAPFPTRRAPFPPLCPFAPLMPSHPLLYFKRVRQDEAVGLCCHAVGFDIKPSLRRAPPL